MANWARMINSAQRRITLTNVLSPGWQNIPLLEFEIQGLVAHLDGAEPKLYAYADMAESGVVSRGVRPLSVWERIRRKPALIGELTSLQGNRVRLSYWTDPELCLEFDLDLEDDAKMWRESEIMALSGGFHFKTPPELADIIQQG